MSKPVKGRHQARKRAVDLLFEAEARGLSPVEIVEVRTALTEAKQDVAALNPYTETVARGVGEHTAHIDDLISSHLQGWTLDRLPAVDRAILRVAVWELLHAEDVPEPVAVDEAVQLAKELSTDESPSFINGVLGQVMLVAPQIRAAAQAVRSTADGSRAPRNLCLDPAGAARRHRLRPVGDGGAGRRRLRCLWVDHRRVGAVDLRAGRRRLAVSLRRTVGPGPSDQHGSRSGRAAAAAASGDGCPDGVDAGRGALFERRHRVAGAALGAPWKIEAIEAIVR